MRAIVYFLIVLLVLFVSFASLRTSLFVPHVEASSQQAYQDYQFQYDLYRQRLTDFTIARNEYQKYRSLTSENTTLEKAKALLAQRNSALRSYLVFLHEKLSENPGLVSSERNLYQTIIGNEIFFLDGHSPLVASMASLEDAERVSDQFASHYKTAATAIRQTILAIQLGYLTYFAGMFDTAANQAQNIITTNRNNLSPTKQATLDRWLVSVSNKRSLYLQKVAAVRQAAFKLSGKINEQERVFSLIQNEVTSAKLYLTEGTSYLREMATVMRYAD